MGLRALPSGLQGSAAKKREQEASAYMRWIERRREEEEEEEKGRGPGKEETRAVSDSNLNSGTAASFA